MKKEELLQIEQGLNEIKRIADKESYLVSSAINNQYIKIEPILKQELQRMDAQGVEINCPRIKTIPRVQVWDKEHDMFEYTLSNEDFDSLVNDNLRDLVNNGYKIIDYGYKNNCDDVIIKYTD